MDEPANALPAAGWYPDPATGQQRWWDGANWQGYAGVPVPGQGANHSPAQAHIAANPPPWMSPYTAARTGLADNSRSMATLAHVSVILFPIVGPVAIYFLYQDKDSFVRHHAAEAVNFTLTLFLGIVVSFVLMIILIGLLLFFVVLLAGLIFAVVAAIAANKGEFYRYPMTFRFIT